MDWEIKVKYGKSSFVLQAEKVYESAQIMRIKVYGKKGHVLLENNYPFLQFSNGGSQLDLLKGSRPYTIYLSLVLTFTM